jgi:hypothetical protein
MKVRIRRKSLFFSLLAGNSIGDGFDIDYVRHHALSRYRRFPPWEQIAPELAASCRTILCVTTAYEKALILLGLKDRNDPPTELVAKHIVEVAQTGERDFEVVCNLAISLLNGTDREAC